MSDQYDMTGEDAIPRNADLAFNYTWLKDDGTPQDLTGYVFDFAVWRTRNGNNGADDPLIQIGHSATADGQITVPNPTDGKIFYLIAQEKLASLDEGEFYYYSRVTTPGGVELLTHGKFQTFGALS